MNHTQRVKLLYKTILRLHRGNIETQNSIDCLQNLRNEFPSKLYKVFRWKSNRSATTTHGMNSNDTWSAIRPKRPFSLRNGPTTQCSSPSNSDWDWRGDPRRIWALIWDHPIWSICATSKSSNCTNLWKRLKPKRMQKMRQRFEIKHTILRLSQKHNLNR